ncbi:MAG: hemerythrin domain-containing protein [Phycisphaerales bacterium]
MNFKNEYLNRRNFVSSSALLTIGALFTKSNKEENNKEILPNEDLMREHGILRRIMLIYEQSLKMPQADAIEPIKQSAQLVRNFVEDYHEKLEEEFLFPRFRKQNVLTELVDTLQQQHDATRKLTDILLNPAKEADFQKINKVISLFINVYRPHAAREDTELFPRFREITNSQEYAHLGEIFEDWEMRLFGENGFKDMVNKVEVLERKVGIYLLGKFTPNVL